MDPWYPLGRGDMVQAASLALHVCQMSGTAEIDACFDMVTWKNAEILALEGLRCGARLPGRPRRVRRLQQGGRAADQPGVHPRPSSGAGWSPRTTPAEPHGDGQRRSTSRSATERGVSVDSERDDHADLQRAASRHALRAERASGRERDRHAAGLRGRDARRDRCDDRGGRQALREHAAAAQPPGGRGRLPLRERRGAHTRRATRRPTRPSSMPAGPASRMSPDYGGKGLPQLISMVFDEMVCSTNLAFGVYPAASPTGPRR